MWNDTALSRRLGIDFPIIQGPFGGNQSSSALTAAAANAGGLGSFGAHMLSAPQIMALAAEIRGLTARPFALNLWIPDDRVPVPTLDRAAYDRSMALMAPYYRELGIDAPAFPEQIGQPYDTQIEAVLEARPPVFSFVFGIPAPDILRACRARDICTIGTATTPDEAVALEAAGVDAVVATGFEAGGHRVSFLKPAEACLTGTLALVPQVVDRVKIPVIAAGGIADGRGIAACLALGAHGVQIGTAFLACEESAASTAHRARLLGGGAHDTVLTRAFTGRLARGIRNGFSDAMAAREAAILPYPLQRWLTGTLQPAAVAQGRTDLITMQAGQAAPLVRHRRAAALMAALVRETGERLAQLTGHAASGAIPR